MSAARPDRRPARQHAEQIGRRAVGKAAWALRLKSYRLLARRYRAPVGEIELVARRGRLLLAVEVVVNPDTVDLVRRSRGPCPNAVVEARVSHRLRLSV